MEIWAWLNNQLLKMQWLSDLVKRLVEAVFGLSMQSPWAFGGTAPSFGARSWVAIYAGERGPTSAVRILRYQIKGVAAANGSSLLHDTLKGLSSR